MRIVRKQARKKNPELSGRENCCGLLTTSQFGFPVLTLPTETMNKLRPSTGRSILQKPLRSSRNAVPRPAISLTLRFAATGSSEVLYFLL